MAELGVYYVIKHKESGEYMPELERRGYSFWNPTTKSYPNSMTGTPRILSSRKKANRCIVMWAYMPNAREHVTTSYFGEEEIDLSIKPDGRKKEDLEVIEVEISER